MHADLRAAARSDDIADAVNYKTVAKQVIEMVENSQFYLVEKRAGEIAAIGFADPRVTRAIVTVEKPGAVRVAQSVGVTIDRRRDE